MTRGFVERQLRDMYPDVVEEFYPKRGVTVRVSITESGWYVVERIVNNNQHRARKTHSLSETVDLVIWLCL